MAMWRKGNGLHLLAHLKNRNNPQNGSTGQTKQPTQQTSIKKEFDAPEAAKPRVNINKVIEKAEMMVKDGGGSVKIDLGTNGMGSLDLAIDVNNNKIDVRIVTASDQVKDIIVADLNKLKDSLQMLNLDLGQVEVGLKNQNNQSSFDFGERLSDQHGNQGSPFEDSEKEFFSTPLPKMFSKPKHTNQHLGQISVRV